MGGSLSSRPFYGVCRRVRGCSPGTGSIPECSTRPKIHTKEMKQAKENPGQAQGVMFKVPAGDMPMEEVVKHIISAVDKQARKDQNGG